jgi:hypothetical protein
MCRENELKPGETSNKSAMAWTGRRAQYLLLQEQGLHQGLNLGHDEDLWRPPPYLPRKFHNSRPGPVPEVVERITKVSPLIWI